MTQREEDSLSLSMNSIDRNRAELMYCERAAIMSLKKMVVVLGGNVTPLFALMFD